MIDAVALARTQPEAILINTARGELVDQSALYEALGDNRLAAVGLDVFDAEPIAPDAPILTLPNVVTTPHVSWLTRETLLRSIDVAVENCARIEAGRDLLHRVV